MKTIKLIIFALLSLTISGCAVFVGESTVTEYDKDGNITKVTVSNTPVLSNAVAGLKNKSWVAWEDSWAAFIGRDNSIVEDPTSFKLFVGKSNKGMIAITKDQKGLGNIPDIISATGSSLEVTPNGVNNTSKNTVKEPNENEKEAK